MTAPRTTTKPSRASVARLAKALATELRKLHGGQWDAVTIDHKGRFILIRQRLPKGATR